MADVNSNGQPINLSVMAEEDIFADKDGKLRRSKPNDSVLFRINMLTKLKKLKRAYCTKVGVCPEAILFTFGGLTVLDTHSPADLYMVSSDIILCRQEPSYLNRICKIPSTRVSDFDRLIENHELCDVRLLLGQSKLSVPAVKAILCARSEKFRGMFSKNFFEGRQAEVELSSANPTSMKILLRYLYTDEVDMPESAEEAAGLLMLAEEYMLPVLKRECEIYLLARVSEKNVCHLLQTADMYGSNLLKDKCKRYLLENMDTKPDLGEELEKTPKLLLEITRDACIANKRRRIL